MKTAKKKTTTKRVHQPWFKAVRGSYIPVHWKGWLTYIPYVVYLYLTFMMLDRNRSIPETVLFLVPYWVAGVIIMHWVAKQKS
jgi:hypothetical protein